MIEGTLDIGGNEIGRWTAARADRYGTMYGDTYYNYNCTLDYRGTDGYPYHAEFQVVHRYGDGAVVLAGKVLFAGQTKLKRVTPSGIDS